MKWKNLFFSAKSECCGAEELLCIYIYIPIYLLASSPMNEFEIQKVRVEAGVLTQNKRKR